MLRTIGSMNKLLTETVLEEGRRRERDARNEALRARLREARRTGKGALGGLRGLNMEERGCANFGNVCASV